jgi:hypothetical protein
VRKVKDSPLAFNFLEGEESAMFNRAAMIAFLVFMPLSAFAVPKEKETIKLQVVTTKTRIHGSFSNHAFAYTDLLFTQVNGKKVVYECVQHGDICPMVEPGNTYTVDRDGAFIYISMSTPEDKKAVSVKFRQVGSW